LPPSGVEVFIDSDYLNFSKKANPLVINTNTRAGSKTEAYSKLYALGKTLAPYRGIIIKKIDTAYRGNVGAEIDAVFDSWGPNLCFVVNSIPSMGRITLGGKQVFGKKPLQEAGFLTDPSGSIKTSYVPRLLAGTQRPVCLIGLEDIRKDAKNLQSLIKDKEKKGCRIMVFDSCTNQDIEVIVDRLWENFSCFWAGSLGLLEIVSKKLSPGPKLSTSLPRTGLVLGFSASAHKITTQQLRTAQAKGRLKLVGLEVEKATGPAGKSYIRSLAEENRPFWTKLPLFLIPRKDAVEKPGMDKKILAAMSEAARVFCKKFKAERLVLLGGDTSFSILDSLGTRVVKIEGQIEQAIDYGTIIDGKMGGCSIILKGGSVGNRDSVVNMLNF